MSDYKLIVYPNPNGGLFRILMEIDKAEDLEIKVFDISGKLMYLDELNNINGKISHEIDLSHLEKGLYQLHLKTQLGVFNKTVVIQ